MTVVLKPRLKEACKLEGGGVVSVLSGSNCGHFVALCWEGQWLRSYRPPECSSLLSGCWWSMWDMCEGCASWWWRWGRQAGREVGSLIFLSAVFAKAIRPSAETTPWSSHLVSHHFPVIFILILSFHLHLGPSAFSTERCDTLVSIAASYSGNPALEFRLGEWSY